MITKPMMMFFLDLLNTDNLRNDLGNLEGYSTQN